MEQLFKEKEGMDYHFWVSFSCDMVCAHYVVDCMELGILYI